MSRKFQAHAVVLAVAAIGLIGQPAQVAGQVTGSGTPGTLPKWTGTTTQGDSIIVESGGLIGVGTSTPTVKLDVNPGDAGRRWHLAITPSEFDPARGKPIAPTVPEE